MFSHPSSLYLKTEQKNRVICVSGIGGNKTFSHFDGRNDSVS